MKEWESFHISGLLYRPVEVPYPAVMAQHALTRMFKRSQRFSCFWLSRVDLSEDLSVLQLQKERDSHSFRYTGLERKVLTSTQSHTDAHARTSTVPFYCFSFLYHFRNSSSDKNVNKHNHKNNGWGQVYKWRIYTDWWLIERWSV